MRIAIPTWCERVSPVFDVASCLTVFDVEGNIKVGRELVGIDGTGPLGRALRLGELGVNTLICGAISAPLEAAVAAAGVPVVAGACGPVEAVLRAFLDDDLADNAYLMPGCRGRQQRSRDRRLGQREA
jgi:predicted Fe-Mo cluster-binding NifX family protein